MTILEHAQRLWKAGLSFSGAKWLLLGSCIGLVCGICGFIFVRLIDFGSTYVMASFVGYQDGDPSPGHQALEPSILNFNPAYLIVVLVVGAFISAWIRMRWAGETRLQGTAMAVEAFHNERGQMEAKHWLARFFTTVITLISGGSAGREGPIAMVGAGCGSLLGGRLKLSRRDLRILLIAGMAGGIAAIFRAPLAGTLFAAEVLYAESDLEADSIIPGFISAVTAFCCFGLLESFLFPQGGGNLSVALFSINQDADFAAQDMLQLIPYAGIAIAVCALMWFMRFAYFWTERVFIGMPIPEICKPAVGALLTGLCALALYWVLGDMCKEVNGAHMPLAVLGSGYGIVQDAFDADKYESAHLLTIVIILSFVALGKIITSSLTIGSGGSGGLFGPSMVIGACLGAAIGVLFQMVGVEQFMPPMTACIVMGMACALTANFRTPLAALLMVSELTGGYQLLLPAMWVCSLSFMLSGRRGLIATQVPTQLHSSAHRGHFFNDVLTGIKVKTVFNPERNIHTLHPESNLDECKHLITDTHQNIYPVIDNDNHLTGIFSMNDLRSFLYDESLGLVAVAQDIATDHMIVIHPNDSLATTMRRFTELNVEELPVVKGDDDMTFLGLLSRREVITHYNKVVDELRAMRKAEGYEDVTADQGSRTN